MGSNPILSFALALLLAAAPAARAQELVSDSTLFPYAGQGPFVVIPAKVISSPAYQAGYLVGIVACLPASLIQDARSRGETPHNKAASFVCGKHLSRALGWPVYAVAGLPFFVLKGLFWDGPQALFGASKD